MCRDGPIDSATISAQKPGCSVSPALSEAQTGRFACGVGATMSATKTRGNARVMSRFLLDVSCGNIQLSRHHSESRR